MIGSTYLGFAAVALASFSSASVVEQDWISALLKRQAPGTPSFDCHSNCGNSITLSRGADPCNNDAFVTQYEYCLSCAGPSSLNIWRIYGTTLSAAGTKCGFSTTPGTPTPSQPETVTTITPSVPSSTPTTTTAPPVKTPVSSSSATVSVSVTASASSATSSTVTVPSATVPIGTASSGLPTTTTGPLFTAAANAQHVVGLGALGAAVLALLI